MVSYKDVQASNARIPSVLPSGMVAVFCGATSGIGEYTLKAFARHAKQPKVYFVGRSQAAADRILGECKALNPEGQFIFMKCDVSLMTNVDDVCREIKSKEQSINLLCLSQGTISLAGDTSEGLSYMFAVVFMSRVRFMVNLLPLLQRATAVRRVVSVFAGGKEAEVHTENLQYRKLSDPIGTRGHVVSMMDFAHEHLAKQAPGVSFVNGWPGAVRSNMSREWNAIGVVMKVLFAVAGPFMCIPEEESGERHLFLLTSARFPPMQAEEKYSSIPLQDGVKVARGDDGRDGSGVYIVDEHCETVGGKVEELLAKMRKQGVAEKVWENIENEFKRITGAAAI